MPIFVAHAQLNEFPNGSMLHFGQPNKLNGRFECTYVPYHISMINDQQIGLTGVNGIFLYFTEELTMIML